MGIDCGSKTVKAVAIDADGKTLYSSYQLHSTDIRGTLKNILHDMVYRIGDVEATYALSGSAGMQIAEMLEIPFVQEVVASKRAVADEIPDADVVIELGGEDSKILFLTGGEEYRMNSTCAGGTGGFIDTIAAMLDTNATGLNRLAWGYTTVHPIASRCAVFAQSDVRPLINEGISRADIAASTFQAVVNQCVAGLACGRPITGKVVMLGGPLHFMDALAFRFRKTLGLDKETGIVPKNAHLFVARGAALTDTGGKVRKLSELEAILKSSGRVIDETIGHLDPLFASEDEYQEFLKAHEGYSLPSKNIYKYSGPAYLGIDSGSTTMKCVLIDDEGNVLWTYYTRNAGDVISIAKRMLQQLYYVMKIPMGVPEGLHIAKAAVTGYGEDLLKQALRLDMGVVETVAHLKAVQHIMPDVDFILDIGGQDIKCIRTRDGIVEDVTLNEACSSGCGALLNGFSHSLHMTDYLFAQKALLATDPVDLGTRCTVFMTSRVRHAQKEGATVGDISAGLAYSVVRNALFRVIRIHDVAELGQNVAVSGGTFKNDAVLRAFEKLLGRQVARADSPELMGAYGTALYAMEHDDDGKASAILGANEAATLAVKRQTRHCELCPNHCFLTECTFADASELGIRDNSTAFLSPGATTDAIAKETYHAPARHFVTGNKCSRGAGIQNKHSDVPDLVDYQYRRVFESHTINLDEATRGTIGIPRALMMFDQFPYWQAFFTELGYHVELSPRSSNHIYSEGMATIPTETTCYPAKLAHGHVIDLISSGVKTVFMPRFMRPKDAQGHMDCPVLTDYPQVIATNIDAIEDGSVRLLAPRVTEPEVGSGPQVEELRDMFAGMDDQPSDEQIASALKAAAEAQACYRRDLALAAATGLEYLQKNGGQGMVLSCRPYHVDPEVHHGITGLLIDFGLVVFTTDMLAALGTEPQGLYVDNRWRIPARQYSVAQRVKEDPRLDIIELHSFGCGIDAISVGQTRVLMGDRVFCDLKIDEMINTSAMRIRIRSLLTALEERRALQAEGIDVQDDVLPLDSEELKERAELPLPKTAKKAVAAAGAASISSTKSDAPMRLICPDWMPLHMRLIASVLERSNIQLVLPHDGNELSAGLACADNDLCLSTLALLGRVDMALRGGEQQSQTTAQTYDGMLVPLSCADCRASDAPGLVRNMASEDGDSWEALTLTDMIAQQMLSQEGEKTLAEAVVEGDVQLALKCREHAISEPRAQIAVVGAIPIALSPKLNNGLFDIVQGEGCQVLSPLLATQLVHAMRASAEHRPDEQKAALQRFATMLEDCQQEGADKLAQQGITMPCTYRHLLQIAKEEGLDCAVTAGGGWTNTAQMCALIEEGVPNILFVQSFACLSGCVSGAGMMRWVRTRFPGANLTSLDFDPGTSRVNQVNRIKLLAALAADGQSEKA